MSGPHVSDPTTRFLLIAREAVAEAARGALKYPKDASAADGTRNGGMNLVQREQAQNSCDRAAHEGTQTFAKILEEEFWEAMCEEDKTKLRVELLQVAGVAIQWVDKLDREGVPVASTKPLVDWEESNDGITWAPCDYGNMDTPSMMRYTRTVRK
jgi:hypothetical protein